MSNNDFNSTEIDIVSARLDVYFIPVNECSLIFELTFWDWLYDRIEWTAKQTPLLTWIIFNPCIDMSPAH